MVACETLTAVSMSRKVMQRIIRTNADRKAAKFVWC